MSFMNFCLMCSILSLAGNWNFNFLASTFSAEWQGKDPSTSCYYHSYVTRSGMAEMHLSSEKFFLVVVSFCLVKNYK